MGVALRSGRDFSSSDRSGAPPVVVVSDNLAAQLWPGQNALGKRLLDTLGNGNAGRPPEWRTVVGVVGAGRYREIERPRFDFFVPLGQAEGFDPESIVVKTAQDPRASIPMVASALSRVDPQLTAADISTMDDLVRGGRAPWRFNMLLFGAFGCMSIGLTVIGIAGLIVSTVNWRRREIGVRLALGAQTHDVVSLITVEGVRLIGAGVGLGLLLSLLASRLLATLSFGAAAIDPRALSLVAAAVFACGVLATWLPARRAATFDAASVFRES